MLGLFTRERGLLSAAARGARKASSKLGALEPLHTLRVSLELSSQSDVAKLREARIERARLGLLEQADRLEAASRLLRLARSVLAPAVPEPAAFDRLEADLDQLDAAPPGQVAAVAARAGANLIGALGYGLDLSACVRCGTACPPASSALLDPSAGGLVCRACGGGPVLLRAADRETLLRFMAGEGDLPEPLVALLVRLVDALVEAHAPVR